MRVFAWTDLPIFGDQTLQRLFWRLNSSEGWLLFPLCLLLLGLLLRHTREEVVADVGLALVRRDIPVQRGLSWN